MRSRFQAKAHANPLGTGGLATGSRGYAAIIDARPSQPDDPKRGATRGIALLAELLGFGRDGLPGIDDLFYPYLREHFFTGEIASQPSPGLLAAADSFYGGPERLAQIARGEPDNPLNFWADDPLTTLTGDARIDMAAYSSYNKHHLALRRPQFELLRSYAADPELWQWIQQAKPAGPTE